MLRAADTPLDAVSVGLRILASRPEDFVGGENGDDVGAAKRDFDDGAVVCTWNLSRKSDVK